MPSSDGFGHSLVHILHGFCLDLRSARACQPSACSHSFSGLPEGRLCLYPCKQPVFWLRHCPRQELVVFLGRKECHQGSCRRHVRSDSQLVHARVGVVVQIGGL